MYDVSGQTDYPPPHRDGVPRPVVEREESGFQVREPADEYRCMSEQPHPPHDITRSWSDTPLRCPGLRPPAAGRRSHIVGCDGQHDEVAGCLLTIGPADPPADPPTDWLMAWASGWMAGYATGHEHGHEDGEREYGESLADALTPMRRAAAHGIDVALARGAWQQHQRRMGGDQDA